MKSFKSFFDISSFAHELKDLPLSVRDFCLKPTQHIQISTDWAWPTYLILQSGIAALAGTLFGILNLNLIDTLIGFTLFPIIAIIVSLVVSLFIYYYFAFFAGTYVNFKKLYGIVAWANIPYLIFHVLAGMLPPIDLIGFAMTCMLMIIGLVRQLHMSKKLTTRLGIALFVVFFLLWSTNMVRNKDVSRHLQKYNTPEAIDKLEKEL